jgi:pyruvyltransferase
MIASSVMSRGTDTVIRYCRSAVARHHGYQGGAGDDDCVRLYWCEGVGRPAIASWRLVREGHSLFAANFGDSLSPLVISLITGKRVAYASGRNKLIALGSIFFALQDDDVVWGAGLAHPRQIRYARSARNVTYRAVRGPGTRRLLRQHGIDCGETFGDPATLLPLFIANDIPARYEVGIVPHWTQCRGFRRAVRDPAVRIIDVCDTFDQVAREILACRLILSTSLHGLIFAEAYGIPALLVFADARACRDRLKFEDYFESTDRDMCSRTIARAADIVTLSAQAVRVPAPRFRRDELLAAFPQPALPPPSAPQLRWSDVRPTHIGCYGSGRSDPLSAAAGPRLLNASSMTRSPGIPDRFIAWAREREMIVVAGANQALKYRRRIRRGLGTRERPFSGTQSIEAAVALLDQTGTAGRTLHVWGYGRAVDAAQPYFYRARNGQTYEIRFFGHDSIGNLFNYSEPAARGDVKKLVRAVRKDAHLSDRDVMFVGCSWGAAIVDYGLTHARGHAAGLPGPGVAVGGPRQLVAFSARPPLPACVLSDNGDHEQLWVQRHPEDPIGRGGLWPLLYFFHKHLHDYSIRDAQGRNAGAGVWGISGE